MVATCLIASTSLFAQSYGLTFVGHEEVQDNRTSLDLSPDQPFCLKGTIELTFDMTFVPNYQTYFGYIFRIIQDKKQHIDLLYDQKASCFKVVVGERFSQAVIRFDSAHLFHQWNHIKIRFNLSDKTLGIYTNNKLVLKDKVPFSETGCFKILFGGNEFSEFRTKDLPPMNIKDIVLSENDERRFYWPLNETKGTSIKDEVAGRLAVVKNPVWIKSLHSEWKPTGQFTLRGYANVAFDPTSETVYVVGSENQYQYSIQNRKDSKQLYKNSPQNLFRGSQAVYNPFTVKLYNFFVDQKAVSVYNPHTKVWSTESITPNPIQVTEYWHANKFVSRVDSSLYILGGYGQLTYKNTVLRYHFPTKKWDTLVPNESVYMPRYLAALGTTSTTDTAYIMGGYGSITGEQTLNPRSTYDFLQYQVKENTFKKLYELNVPKTDFAFANSLVIDPKARLYYGLIFPNQQFKSQLQLIRGSLTKPTYEAVGTPIPYRFHDTHSYADLYFCPISQKLVAVTLYYDEASNSTDVKLYMISFPPNGPDIQPGKASQAATDYWWLALVGVIGGILIFLFFRRSRRFARNHPPRLHRSDRHKEELSTGKLPAPIQLAIPADDSRLTPEPPLQSSIFFFGNFQVLDHTGYDITKAFTPLLKELFLLLSLNSIGKQRGVASEKLNEILWPDKSSREASNNRSVNITKLRNLLEKVEFCSISKESGYWKIEFNFSQQLYVDYERYMAIISDKTVLTKQAIIELGKITKRGPFLQNTEYYWLDDFKADISNKIINTFLKYANTLTISEDPELLIQITNFIFDYDPVSEDAIILKCKALSVMGKHTLAKNTFEKFIRDYKAIYGEEYKQPFSAIID